MKRALLVIGMSVFAMMDAGDAAAKGGLIPRAEQIRIVEKAMKRVRPGKPGWNIKIAGRGAQRTFQARPADAPRGKYFTYSATFGTIDASKKRIAEGNGRGRVSIRHSVGGGGWTAPTYYESVAKAAKRERNIRKEYGLK